MQGRSARQNQLVGELPSIRQGLVRSVREADGQQAAGGFSTNADIALKRRPRFNRHRICGQAGLRLGRLRRESNNPLSGFVDDSQQISCNRIERTAQNIQVLAEDLRDADGRVREQRNIVTETAQALFDNQDIHLGIQ